MTAASRKTSTDIHWDERAQSGIADEKVNIGDTTQRELETQFVLSALPAAARLLEVGCGNGYLTRLLREKAGFVDAFDYAEQMVERARRYAGETNNRFFCDNVLDMKQAAPSYDAIVCVRVLINLRNLEEQVQAVENLAARLPEGGTLILVEGFRDGFGELSALRERAGLSPLTPAAINFYSRLEELQPVLERYFSIGATFHSGMFDFLTRVVYPLQVGADKVVEAGEFHRQILPLAQAFNPDDFAPLARLRGFALVRQTA